VRPRENDPPEPSGRKYVVARAADIAPGERRIVRVRGRSYGVFNVDGTFHALLNRCPHQGGELCKGPLQMFVEADAPGQVRFDGSQSFVQCPWHGWEFDIRTGQSYADPARTRVRSYPVGVRSGDGLAGRGGGEDGVGRAEQERIVAGGVHKTVVSGRIAGPFTAEKVPVSVEADYVVLILPR
jgi:3-phenylpropionate/trans-cinnamate dioxygenase ferredoxin subunit